MLPSDILGIIYKNIPLFSLFQIDPQTGNELFRNRIIKAFSPEFNEVLIKCEAVLSGSCVLSLLTGTPETPGDIDIFVNESNYELLKQYLLQYTDEKNDYTRLFDINTFREGEDYVGDTWNNSTMVAVDNYFSKRYFPPNYKFTPEELFASDHNYSIDVHSLLTQTFQVIVIRGDPKEYIRNNYDFRFLRNIYDGKELVIDYPEDIEKKVMHLNKVRPMKLCNRSLKYLRRGYTMGEDLRRSLLTIKECPEYRFIRTINNIIFFLNEADHKHMCDYKCGIENSIRYNRRSLSTVVRPTECPRCVIDFADHPPGIHFGNAKSHIHICTPDLNDNFDIITISNPLTLINSLVLKNNPPEEE